MHHQFRLRCRPFSSPPPPPPRSRGSRSGPRRRRRRRPGSQRLRRGPDQLRPQHPWQRPDPERQRRLSGSPVTTGSIATYPGQRPTVQQLEQPDRRRRLPKVTQQRHQPRHLLRRRRHELRRVDHLHLQHRRQPQRLHPYQGQLDQRLGGHDQLFQPEVDRSRSAPVNSPGNFVQLAIVNYAPFSGNASYAQFQPGRPSPIGGTASWPPTSGRSAFSIAQQWRLRPGLPRDST